MELMNVRFQYGGRKVLDGVSFTLQPGRTTGLLGRNGSGKSTLHGLLCGLLPWQQGQLIENGKLLCPTASDFRSVTGVVFQKNSLDLKLSPLQNLMLGGELFGLTRGQRAQRANDLLLISGLSERARDRTADLSGGLQRRLDLMRALMHSPSWLFLDEPTSGLDEVAFRAVWTLLETLQQQEGLGIFVVTHRPEEAERCHHIHFLQNGKLAGSGTPQELRKLVEASVVEVRSSHLGDVFLKLTGDAL